MDVMKSTKRMVLTTLVGVLALSSIGFSAARAKSSKKHQIWQENSAVAAEM